MPEERSVILHGRNIEDRLYLSGLRIKEGVFQTAGVPGPVLVVSFFRKT
jgi:hypothetical protein